MLVAASGRVGDGWPVDSEIVNLSSNTLDKALARAMLDLNDFFYFVQVVERGGFTAAGRALGMPKSTLSYRMQQLEAKLGVRLLNRNSRHFAPTQAGEDFYRQALGVVNAAEAAESLVRQRAKEPSGVVRFSAAIGTAQFALRDILMKFIQEHPKVDVVEYLTSRNVDLLAENFDIAIRAHSSALADSTLVSRTLAVAPWILVAGAKMLARTTTPKTPEDLKQLPALFLWQANTTPAWRLQTQGRTETVQPFAPRLVSNDMSTLKQAAIAGMGLVALPGYFCKKELRSGELTRVLPGWLAGESTFTALLPHRRGLLPAVKIFVDYLARHLSKYVASVFLATLMLGPILAGCNSGPVRTVRRVEFVRTLFQAREHVADFRNMKAYFPTAVVRASGHPGVLEQGPQIDLPASFDFRGTRIDTSSFLDLTDTTGLIVVKDDKVVFERYFRGTDTHTRTVAWSLSKSFASALVGIAVGEGKIHSINDPVTQYAPELVGSAYDGVPIKDVLQMSSGARWTEDYGDPHSDVVRFGHAVAFGRPLDTFAASLTREHAPGTYLRYNSMDTQVLGMVLRHATGTSLADYLSTRIWQPLGMQDDAYYLTDRSGVAFAAGGLNATLRDYARFGLLYAHYGNWRGAQIVPVEWVRASVTPDAPQLMPGRRPSSAEFWGYGYQWWVPDLRGAYTAVGIFNQFIYVNPRERLVIAKSSANHTYGTGRGEDESKDHESAHLALFKAIETALSNDGRISESHAAVPSRSGPRYAASRPSNSRTSPSVVDAGMRETINRVR